MSFVDSKKPPHVITNSNLLQTKYRGTNFIQNETYKNKFENFTPIFFHFCSGKCSQLPFMTVRHVMLRSDRVGKEQVGLVLYFEAAAGQPLQHMVWITSPIQQVFCRENICASISQVHHRVNKQKGKNAGYYGGLSWQRSPPRSLNYKLEVHKF